MIDINTSLGTMRTVNSAKRATRIDLDADDLERLVLQAIHRDNPDLAMVSSVSVSVDFKASNSSLMGAVVIITQRSEQGSND